MPKPEVSGGQDIQHDEPRWARGAHVKGSGLPLLHFGLLNPNTEALRPQKPVGGQHPSAQWALQPATGMRTPIFSEAVSGWLMPIHDCFNTPLGNTTRDRACGCWRPLSCCTAGLCGLFGTAFGRPTCGDGDVRAACWNRCQSLKPADRACAAPLHPLLASDPGGAGEALLAIAFGRPAWVFPVSRA